MNPHQRQEFTEAFILLFTIVVGVLIAMYIALLLGHNGQIMATLTAALGVVAGIFAKHKFDKYREKKYVNGWRP